MSMRRTIISLAVVMPLVACGGGGGGGGGSVATARTLDENNAGGIAEDVVEALLMPIAPLTDGSVVQLPNRSQARAHSPQPVARELVTETELCVGGGQIDTTFDDENLTSITIDADSCIEGSSTIDGQLVTNLAVVNETQLTYGFQFNNFRIADSGENTGGVELDITLDGSDQGTYTTESDRDLLVGVSNITVTMVEDGETDSFTLTDLEHALEVRALGIGVELTQSAAGLVTLPEGIYAIQTLQSLVSQDNFEDDVTFVSGVVQITAPTGESMFVEVVANGQWEILITYTDGEQLTLTHTVD